MPDMEQLLRDLASVNSIGEKVAVLVEEAEEWPSATEPGKSADYEYYMALLLAHAATQELLVKWAREAIERRIAEYPKEG